jgi:hypothetical protein
VSFAAPDAAVPAARPAILRQTCLAALPAGGSLPGAGEPAGLRGRRCRRPPAAQTQPKRPPQPDARPAGASSYAHTRRGGPRPPPAGTTRLRNVKVTNQRWPPAMRAAFLPGDPPTARKPAPARTAVPASKQAGESCQPRENDHPRGRVLASFRACSRPGGCGMCLPADPVSAELTPRPAGRHAGRGTGAGSCAVRLREEAGRGRHRDPRRDGGMAPDLGPGRKVQRLSPPNPGEASYPTVLRLWCVEAVTIRCARSPARASGPASSCSRSLPGSWSSGHPAAPDARRRPARDVARLVDVQTGALGLAGPGVGSLVTVPPEKELLEGVMGVTDVTSDCVPERSCDRTASRAGARPAHIRSCWPSPPLAASLSPAIRRLQREGHADHVA